MNKTLSETHPTLWKRAAVQGSNSDVYLIPHRLADDIQSCTVDVAEHDKMKELHDLALKSEIELLKEVERLRKEIEFMKNDSNAFDVGFVEGARLKKQVEAERRLRYDLWEQQKAEGVVEGERRATEKAIERVKEAILFVANDKLGGEISECKELCLLWDELGLGEEEKR